MAHLITFTGIEKKNRVRIRHRLISSDMTHYSLLNAAQTPGIMAKFRCMLHVSEKPRTIDEAGILGKIPD
jgi:hypothetical protein